MPIGQKSVTASRRRDMPGSSAVARTPALFGRVMALAALAAGFATLGVWIARDWAVPAGS